MTLFSFRRASFSATIAFVALVLSGGAVLADTEAGHTGDVGAHMLRDTLDKPGVTCRYEDTQTPGVPLTLTTFKVKPPKVWARDVTAGLDRQKVGWRFIVEQNRFDSAGWMTFYRSPIQKAPASEVDFAAFSVKTAR